MSYDNEKNIKRSTDLVKGLQYGVSAGQEHGGRTIQVLDRAAAVLEALSTASAGIPLAALAARVQLKPQTLQSLLRTLQHHGLVVQEGRGEPYLLGPRLHEWARSWVAQADYAAIARPFMAALGHRLREYLLLSQFRGERLVRLVEQTADRSLTVTPLAENPAHLHTMASAKVLLAWAAPEARQRVVASMRMHKRGPRSITSRSEFLALLKPIVRQGYAECIDESAAGITALAVPVHTAVGLGELVLGVAMPTIRYDREIALEAMRGAARSISLACGYSEAE